MKRILILGGTGLARQLAETLQDVPDIWFISSLAGRTERPAPLAGEIRRGGFGGDAGLLRYLRDERISHLVVAVHPFANVMASTAAKVAAQLELPICRLRPAPWVASPGEAWTKVKSPSAAAEALPANSVALMTTGHRDLGCFLARNDCRLIVRLIDPPQLPLPDHAQLILDRPPYSLNQERRLMQQHGVSHLVTKNAGGQVGRAKLSAALELGVQVIMVQRPKDPVQPNFETPAEVLNWLQI